MPDVLPVLLSRMSSDNPMHHRLVGKRRHEGGLYLKASCGEADFKGPLKDFKGTACFNMVCWLINLLPSMVLRQSINVNDSVRRETVLHSKMTCNTTLIWHRNHILLTLVTTLLLKTYWGTSGPVGECEKTKPRHSSWNPTVLSWFLCAPGWGVANQIAPCATTEHMCRSP